MGDEFFAADEQSTDHWRYWKHRVRGDVEIGFEALNFDGQWVPLTGHRGKTLHDAAIVASYLIGGKKLPA